MPEWKFQNEKAMRMALEGIYLFALKLRVARERGADRPSIELVYEHLINTCESIGLQESAVKVGDSPSAERSR